MTWQVPLIFSSLASKLAAGMESNWNFPIFQKSK